MGTISFTKDDDYSSRKAAIARQEKLAELLSQMGAQEQAVSTAGGITAPVSGMGALARGLTSFGGAYMSGKAAKDAAALDKGEKASVEAERARIFGMTPAVAATPLSQGAYQGVDAEGIPSYDVNLPTPAKAASYVLTPEERENALDVLSGRSKFGEQAAARGFARFEYERDRDQPKMVAAGANGMIDTNPNSPTYGERFAVPPPDEDKTTDIKNYNFAVSKGETRTFPKWLEGQSADKRTVNSFQIGPTGVNYGEPGEGLVWQRGPNNNIVLDARGAPIAIPYQGGKAYLTDEQKKTAAAQEETNKNLATKIVTDEVNRARNIIKTSEIPVTGIAGAIGTRVPGSKARDLKGQLQTIKARIGFDELNRMRKSSPTGGALGQIAVQELGYLQSVYGDLEQNQSEESVLYNLDRLEKEVYRLVNEDLKKPRTAERPPLSSFGGRKP
jgi:hypothetical protein